MNFYTSFAHYNRGWLLEWFILILCRGGRELQVRPRRLCAFQLSGSPAVAPGSRLQSMMTPQVVFAAYWAGTDTPFVETCPFELRLASRHSNDWDGDRSTPPTSFRRQAPSAIECPSKVRSELRGASVAKGIRWFVGQTCPSKGPRKPPLPECTALPTGTFTVPPLFRPRRPWACRDRGIGGGERVTIWRRRDPSTPTLRGN